MAIDTVHIYFKGESPNLFFQQIHDALEGIDFKVELRKDKKQAWLKSEHENAYSIFQNRTAFHAKAVQAISVLDEKYWVLESEQFPKDMDVACFEYDSGLVHERKSEKFFENIKQQYIEPFEHDYPLEDFVLVVLDDNLGKEDGLRPYSSFQMIKQVLKQEPERQIVIWNEADHLLSENARQRLKKFDNEARILFSTGQLDRLLSSCSYLVSQDSVLSIKAMLHQKSAITFGDFAFHHICRNPERDQRMQKSFNRMDRDRPLFERYIYWLLNDYALCCGDKDIGDKILTRFQGFGW